MRFNLSVDRGWYRVSFTYNQKRYTFRIGTKDANTANRRLAEVQRDWVDGRFDWTFTRYRVAGIEQEMKPPEKSANKPKVLELFGQYMEWKRTRIGAQSMRDYEQVRARLKRCKADTCSKKGIQELVIGASGKKIGAILCAFGKWAVEQNAWVTNPFAGWKDSYIPTSNDDEPDPLASGEMSAIIEWMGKNAPQYERLTRFLFLSGCRPGEALELRHLDVSPRGIIFQRTLGTDGRTIQKGLKTQSKRLLPWNESLKALIGDGDATDLVFPDGKGNHINWRYYRVRVWAKCLKELGVRYRKPYCMRHTAITRYIEAGCSSDHVAIWVGNSPEVIRKYYLGEISTSMPVLD